MLSTMLIVVALHQQPGELGSLQGFVAVPGQWATTTEGYRFVPQHWAQGALFSDYEDAKAWYLDTEGNAVVIDSKGNVAFAPKFPTVMALPKPVVPHQRLMSLPPLKQGGRNEIHVRTGTKSKGFQPPTMPTAIRSRTVIPGQEHKP
jgi:hypothetical protein